MLDFIYLFFSFILVILDQFSKKSALKVSESIDITNFFAITLSFNHGISFGFLNKVEQSQIVLVAINLMIVAFLLRYYFTTKNLQSKISITMIVSGAIGNIMDRLSYGFVIDFLDLHYLHYHWPIFNFADIFIVIGVILFMAVEFSQTTQIKTTNYK
jgi:signal peptidase II